MIPRGRRAQMKNYYYNNTSGYSSSGSSCSSIGSSCCSLFSFITSGGCG
ncbi:hypothetical protein PP707_04560 [Acetobacter pasteurianus]|nr:hypothetical protein [Acetobacter pasteurianus]